VNAAQDTSGIEVQVNEWNKNSSTLIVRRKGNLKKL
jgi:hypothetical protein